MLSKARIEQQLVHLKTECQGDEEVNAIWAEALKWVLGDAEHQAYYQTFIALLEGAVNLPTETPREKLLQEAARWAFERLR